MPVGPSRTVNVDQIAWAEVSSDKKAITLYLTTKGPDRKQTIKITDPQFLAPIARTLGINLVPRPRHRGVQVRPTDQPPAHDPAFS